MLFSLKGLPRTLNVAFCLLLLVFVSTPVNADAKEPAHGNRVVAYLPDYRLPQISVEQGADLTDAIFFSIAPEAGTPLKHPALETEHVQKLLKAWREQHGVKITFALGGWDRSAGFSKISSTERHRKDFARNVVRFCDQYGFSGVDLDWEHPQNEEESRNYGRLIQTLKTALGPKRTVTAAVAGWQTLPAVAWKNLDAVHLMSYDGPGRHSTLEMAQTDVQKLLHAGVSPERIRLGVPFYGRAIDGSGRVLTYREIVTSHKLTPAENEADGLYFNGPDLIRAKLAFCREKKLGGIMIWEIGQDAPGDASLLRLIGTELGRSAPKAR